MKTAIFIRQPIKWAEKKSLRNGIEYCTNVSGECVRSNASQLAGSVVRTHKRARTHAQTHSFLLHDAQCKWEFIVLSLAEQPTNCFSFSSSSFAHFLAHSPYFSAPCSVVFFRSFGPFTLLTRSGDRSDGVDSSTNFRNDYYWSGLWMKLWNMFVIFSLLKMIAWKKKASTIHISKSTRDKRHLKSLATRDETK